MKARLKEKPEPKELRVGDVYEDSSGDILMRIKDLDGEPASVVLVDHSGEVEAGYVCWWNQPAKRILSNPVLVEE